MLKKHYLITLPAILFTLILTAGFGFAKNSYADKPACNIDSDIYGEFGGDYYHAYVWNNSENPDCVHNATLAMYEVPQPEGSPLFVDTQRLIRYATQTIKPGEKYELILDSQTDACRIQIDLVRGDVLKEKPYYYNALGAKLIQLKDCGYVESVQATATPVPAKGSVEAASVMKKGVLAGTGNTTVIYSIIIAGAISLISGMVLKKFSK